MEKNVYETYEYLPNNDADGEEQYFIVHEDGTFLINRQVQLVTEVQETKEVLHEEHTEQPCAVYGIGQQPYFVDVENSTELISVPENYIMPDGGSNLFSNSYLLQTMTSSTTNNDQVVENADQYKEGPQEQEIDDSNIDIKQATNCTEITLTDDQYNTLEQKGWVLLKMNNKVFILDTLGLHDITTNQELCQQLKADNNDTRCANIENESTENNNFSQQETFEIVIPSEGDTNKDLVTFSQNNCEDATTKVTVNNKQVMKSSDFDINETNKRCKMKDKVLKDGNVIKIKSKIFSKDLPDKIVLGKLVNGKNLVAKVVKPMDNRDCRNKNVTMVSNTSENRSNDSPECLLESMIQLVLNKTVRNTAHQVAAADNVVGQLLKMPTFRPTLVDRNVLISKVMKNSETSAPIVVTGRIVPIDGIHRFVHVPDLLQKLKAESAGNAEVCTSPPYTTKTSEDYSILHIHVTDMKCSDNTQGLSVTINTKKLDFSNKRVSETKPTSKRIVFSKKRSCKKIFACSSCATIFPAEKELIKHQETNCMDVEDELTIDTNKIDKDGNIKTNPSYCIIKTTAGTMYACLQCSLKFNKLSGCQRHLKTHSRFTNREHSDNDDSNKVKPEGDKSDEPTFKCKMCSSSYYHASTLSKHIVTAHIKVKSN